MGGDVGSLLFESGWMFVGLPSEVRVRPHSLSPSSALSQVQKPSPVLFHRTADTCPPSLPPGALQTHVVASNASGVLTGPKGQVHALAAADGKVFAGCQVHNPTGGAGGWGRGGCVGQGWGSTRWIPGLWGPMGCFEI